MPIINNLSNSLRWQAMQTLLAALRAAPTLAGVRVVHNPRTPAALGDGAHIVFLKDQSNIMSAKPGQAERRTHQFLMVAVARSDAADCEADALHEAASGVLHSCLNTLVRQCSVMSLGEVNTQFESASLEIDGALCLSTWEVVYRIPARTYAGI